MFKAVVRDRIVIKVSENKNRNMITSAIEFSLELPKYAELWIVYDKGKNKNFDRIIDEAENLKIKVVWSNPCIEIWFNAYFGEITLNVRNLFNHKINISNHEIISADDIIINLL